MSSDGIIIGSALPNIPWEERPSDCGEVMWRSARNPVIPADLIPASNSIFNSAVVPYDGEFAGVFRCDHRNRRMMLHAGRSRDGYAWDIEPEPIEFECAIPEIARFVDGYDPRVCRLEDRYYITWCNWYHGAAVGLAYTFDFRRFHQLENAFLPFNRNGVLFPRRIKGKYAMLTRPSDPAHTPFGDIFYSESPDLIHWGCHRHVMSPVVGRWQSTKVGAGPTPIETAEGWLLFYHGVLTSCNGFVYSMGAALLDLEEPWRVIRRTDPYLMAPRALYERVGDVPNVVFPCAALTDAATGRIAVYYGAADTVTCLAYTRIDLLLDFLARHSL